MKTFEMVDWEGHARALNATGGFTMRRIIWGHHPTRSHLKLTGQYPTSMCPLCGETDTRDHFIQCSRINNDIQNKKIRDEMRHTANRKGVPDHLINTLTAVMSGLEPEWERIPFHAREIYKEQETIGWLNMTRGRISSRWGEVRKTNSEGKKDPEKRWRAALIKIILGWTHEKWLLRCQLYKEPEEDLELQEIFAECSEWWES